MSNPIMAQNHDEKEFFAFLDANSLTFERTLIPHMPTHVTKMPLLYYSIGFTPHMSIRTKRTRDEYIAGVDVSRTVEDNQILREAATLAVCYCL